MRPLGVITFTVQGIERTGTIVNKKDGRYRVEVGNDTYFIAENHPNIVSKLIYGKE